MADFETAALGQPRRPYRDRFYWAPCELLSGLIDCPLEGVRG